MKSWRNFFDTFWAECELGEPVNAEAISQSEEELSVALPSELRDFYSESDGIMGPGGDALVMPLADLTEENEDLWLNQEYEGQFMPVECLLFFGKDAFGDLFGYPILSENANPNKIFKWKRKDDSRIFFASSLEEYFYKRWKEWQEGNPLFWDAAPNCKDFEDYRTFLSLVAKARFWS